MNGRGRNRRLQRKVGKQVYAARPSHSAGDDPFGMVRLARIHESKVRYVFTPHRPISDGTLLYGRQAEVAKLIDSLMTPGQHALLFGERGVGKSSLANVVGDLLVDGTGDYKVYTKRCDRSDTFETILQAPLKAVGANMHLTQWTETKGRTWKAQLGADGTSVAGESKGESTGTYAAIEKLSPSMVAELIAPKLIGLLLIDELDAVQGEEDKRKLAELIKHLSDEGAAFKIIMVGIAADAKELTAAHPSVHRCLRETRLGRMGDAELREIVTSGGKALKLHFAENVIDSIVRLSAGYPHFTHLLALKCAEEAIAERRQEINGAHLLTALDSAVADAEGSLKQAYDDAARSTSDMYKNILAAAASMDADEFSSAELRSAIRDRTGEDISQGSLNNYFQRLVSVDDETILRRTGKGMYRFDDPRMRSYVRIVNSMV